MNRSSLKALAELLSLTNSLSDDELRILKLYDHPARGLRNNTTCCNEEPFRSPSSISGRPLKVSVDALCLPCRSAAKGDEGDAGCGGDAADAAAVRLAVA